VTQPSPAPAPQPDRTARLGRGLVYIHQQDPLITERLIRARLEKLLVAGQAMDFASRLRGHGRDLTPALAVEYAGPRRRRRDGPRRQDAARAAGRRRRRLRRPGLLAGVHRGVRRRLGAAGHAGHACARGPEALGGGPGRAPQRGDRLLGATHPVSARRVAGRARLRRRGRGERDEARPGRRDQPHRRVGRAERAGDRQPERLGLGEHRRGRRDLPAPRAVTTDTGCPDGRHNSPITAAPATATRPPVPDGGLPCMPWGLAAYVAAWVAVVWAPASAWSTGAVGFTALAWTSIILFAAVHTLPIAIIWRWYY
jgi:hypothetical protein